MSEEKIKYLVQVKNLRAGFANQSVLKNVSMKAEKEKVTVILGTSGCGKTTLLKNIIRLFSPSQGSIHLFGKDVTTMDEPQFNNILKNIGVLFQNSALLNSITVKDNVAIPLEQHTDLSRGMIDRLIDIKLGLVGLHLTQQRLPSELSGGMRKRAALARAIALDPPLLFCDEPSAGLDPVTAEGLDKLILRMRDELGITVVLVSHTVASIKRIADNVVFLEKGQVLFEGTCKEARQSGIEAIDNFFAKG